MPEPRRQPLRARVALLATALFATSFGLVHVPLLAHRQVSDVPLYQSYASRIRAGRVPYRDFEVVYPPAALPAFLAPTVIRPLGYTRAFQALMAACGCGVMLLLWVGLRRLGTESRRAVLLLALAALTPLLAGPVILSRFDLWPAFLVGAGIVAILSDWLRTAALALGTAIAAKLFPVALVVIAVVYLWRREGGRRATAWLALVTATVAAWLVPFAVLAPGGLATTVTRELRRPLQVESLGAAVLMAAHDLGGLAIRTVGSYGSDNLAGSIPHATALATTAVEAVLVCAVWLVFARGPATQERFVLACAAVVATLVAFGKVFSPQYVLWLMPLVPLAAVRRRSAAVLLAVALVLTQTWYPRTYAALADRYAEPEAWLLLLRDVTVAVLALLLLSTLRERVRPEERVERSPLERQRA